MYICKFCKKDFSGIFTNKQMGGHSSVCKENPNRLKGYKKISKEFDCKKCCVKYKIDITEYQLKKGTYKKFCSNKCAKSRNCDQSKRDKISNTLRKHNSNKISKSDIEYKNCRICTKIFIVKNHSNRKCCSKQCSVKSAGLASKKHWMDPIYRDKMHKSFCMRENSGFKPGNKKYFSEEWVFNYLISKISRLAFIPQYKVKKKELGFESHDNYYLDFYFPDIKTSLEIDGSFHTNRDYIINDSIRDRALISKGYKVIRLLWPNIKNTEQSMNLKFNIDKIIENLPDYLKIGNG